MRCYLKVFNYFGIDYMKDKRLFGGIVSGALVLGGIFAPPLLLLGGIGALATGAWTQYPEYLSQEQFTNILNDNGYDPFFYEGFLNVIRRHDRMSVWFKITIDVSTKLGHIHSVCKFPNKHPVQIKSGALNGFWWAGKTNSTSMSSKQRRIQISCFTCSCSGLFIFLSGFLFISVHGSFIIGRAL